MLSIEKMPQPGSAACFCRMLGEGATGVSLRDSHRPGIIMPRLTYSKIIYQINHLHIDGGKQVYHFCRCESEPPRAHATARSLQEQYRLFCVNIVWIWMRPMFGISWIVATISSGRAYAMR